MPIIVAVIAALISLISAVVVWFQAHSVIKSENKYKFILYKIEELKKVISEGDGVVNFSERDVPKKEDIRVTEVEEEEFGFLVLLKKYHSVKHLLDKSLKDDIEEKLKLVIDAGNEGWVDKETAENYAHSVRMFNYTFMGSVFSELRKTSESMSN